MHQISHRGYYYGNSGNKQSMQGRRNISYAISHNVIWFFIIQGRTFSSKSAMFSLTDFLQVPPLIFPSVICLLSSDVCGWIYLHVFPFSDWRLPSVAGKTGNTDTVYRVFG